MEDPTTCRFTTPIVNGGKFSNTKMSTSLTCRTERHLMLAEEKMLKVNQCLQGADTMEQIRDGRLSTQIKSELKARE